MYNIRIMGPTEQAQKNGLKISWQTDYLLLEIL